MKYLHRKSTIRCIHGGTVDLSNVPDRSMMVNGQSILIAQDINKWEIHDCPMPTTPGSKPCKLVGPVLSGTSSGIEVDGQTPLLSTLVALTDGIPSGLCLVSDDGKSVAEILMAAPARPGNAIRLSSDPVNEQTRSNPTRQGLTVTLELDFSECPGEFSFPDYPCDSWFPQVPVPVLVTLVQNNRAFRWLVQLPLPQPAASPRVPISLTIPSELLDRARETWLLASTPWFEGQITSLLSNRGWPAFLVTRWQKRRTTASQHLRFNNSRWQSAYNDMLRIHRERDKPAHIPRWQIVALSNGLPDKNTFLPPWSAVRIPERIPPGSGEYHVVLKPEYPHLLALALQLGRLQPAHADLVTFSNRLAPRLCLGDLISHAPKFSSETQRLVKGELAEFAHVGSSSPDYDPVERLHYKLYVHKLELLFQACFLVADKLRDLFEFPPGSGGFGAGAFLRESSELALSKPWYIGGCQVDLTAIHGRPLPSELHHCIELIVEQSVAVLEASILLRTVELLADLWDRMEMASVHERRSLYVNLDEKKWTRWFEQVGANLLGGRPVPLGQDLTPVDPPISSLGKVLGLSATLASRSSAPYSSLNKIIKRMLDLSGRITCLSIEAHIYVPALRQTPYFYLDRGVVRIGTFKSLALYRVNALSVPNDIREQINKTISQLEEASVADLPVTQRGMALRSVLVGTASLLSFLSIVQYVIVGQQSGHIDKWSVAKEGNKLAGNLTNVLKATVDSARRGRMTRIGSPTYDAVLLSKLEKWSNVLSRISTGFSVISVGFDMVNAVKEFQREQIMRGTLNVFLAGFGVYFIFGSPMGWVLGLCLVVTVTLTFVSIYWWAVQEDERELLELVRTSEFGKNGFRDLVTSRIGEPPMIGTRNYRQGGSDLLWNTGTWGEDYLRIDVREQDLECIRKWHRLIAKSSWGIALTDSVVSTVHAKTMFSVGGDDVVLGQGLLVSVVIDYLIKPMTIAHVVLSQRGLRCLNLPQEFYICVSHTLSASSDDMLTTRVIVGLNRDDVFSDDNAGAFTALSSKDMEEDGNPVWCFRRLKASLNVGKPLVIERQCKREAGRRMYIYADAQGDSALGVDLTDDHIARLEVLSELGSGSIVSHVLTAENSRAQIVFGINSIVKITGSRARAKRR